MDFNMRFAEFFAEQEASIQVDIFNKYAEATNREPIHHILDFNDVCGGIDPLGLAWKIYYGEFNPYWDYFIFDGRGNIVSLEMIEWWLEDYVDDLAGWYKDRANILTDIIGLDALIPYED